MTGVESTRRDLALIKGYAFVPVEWQSITAADNVLSARDGMTWHVVSIEKHYATAMVRLVSGKRERVVEVGLADPVHVLDHSTGARHEDHVGGDVVRQRKGRS
jgi:hypothetical protein